MMEVTVHGDRHDVWLALKELAEDPDLIDAHARQIEDGQTDWDFGAERKWIAELRTCDVTLDSMMEGEAT